LFIVSGSTDAQDLFLRPTSIRMPSHFLNQFSAGQCLLNGGDSLFVGRKPKRGLLSNHLVSDPDGELASSAFNDVDVGSCCLLDERRHTGSARLVVSHLAKSNANGLHALLAALL